MFLSVKLNDNKPVIAGGRRIGRVCFWISFAGQLGPNSVLSAAENLWECSLYLGGITSPSRESVDWVYRYPLTLGDRIKVKILSDGEPSECLSRDMVTEVAQSRNNFERLGCIALRAVVGSVESLVAGAADLQVLSASIETSYAEMGNGGESPRLSIGAPSSTKDESGHEKASHLIWLDDYLLKLNEEVLFEVLDTEVTDMPRRVEFEDAAQ